MEKCIIYKRKKVKKNIGKYTLYTKKINWKKSKKKKFEFLGWKKIEKKKFWIKMKKKIYSKKKYKTSVGWINRIYEGFIKEENKG